MLTWPWLKIYLPQMACHRTTEQRLLLAQQRATSSSMAWTHYLRKWCWKQHWRFLTTTMTSLRYVFNSILVISDQNGHIHLLRKSFLNIQSPPSRSELREQDFNQQSMLSSEKGASSQTPSPKLCTGQVTKPRWSDRFWTEWPPIQTEWGDRWNHFWTDNVLVYAIIKNPASPSRETTHYLL